MPAQAQDQEVLKKLETIMDGKMADGSGQSFETHLEALRKAPVDELEEMLADPALHEPANQALRDEVINLIAQDRGAQHATQLVEALEIEVNDSYKMPTGGMRIDPTKSPTERAREAFKARNCPLAEIVPEDVKHFLIDADGTFYMELEEETAYEMSDFELAFDRIVSGVAEIDHVHTMNGVWAKKDVDMTTIEIQLQEFTISGDAIIATTNHPRAPIVRLSFDEFRVATEAS